MLIEKKKLRNEKKNLDNYDAIKKEYTDLKRLIDKDIRVSDAKLDKFFSLERKLKDLIRNKQEKTLDSTKKTEKTEKTDYLVDVLFKKGEDIKILEELTEYKKNINFYMKLDLDKSQYIDIEDLNISFLPNFLEYQHYLCILV